METPQSPSKTKFAFQSIHSVSLSLVWRQEILTNLNRNNYITQSNMPSFTIPTIPPLTKKSKEKALKYIQGCERGSKYPIFVDFEARMKDHLDSRAKQTDPTIFTYSFIEYVIMEVTYLNKLQNASSLRKKYSISMSIFELRRESRRLWGATTEHHAKIHRQRITDMLLVRHMHFSFTDEWWYGFSW